MEYKYVTKNNLDNRQDYMYSEFGGIDFMKAYLSNRDVFLAEDAKEQAFFHNTQSELLTIRVKLELGDYLKIKDLLDLYIKRFEVSKRLYNEYDSIWKIVDNASFDNADNYFELAGCCILAYELSNCTKYLSCLLKLDDTLLSIKERMTKGQRKELKEIIKIERDFIEMLSNNLKVEI